MQVIREQAEEYKARGSSAPPSPARSASARPPRHPPKRRPDSEVSGANNAKRVRVGTAEREHETPVPASPPSSQSPSHGRRASDGSRQPLRGAESDQESEASYDGSSAHSSSSSQSSRASKRSGPPDDRGESHAPSS